MESLKGDKLGAPCAVSGRVVMEQKLFGLLAIFCGQHAGKSPVICFDFIDDDMNVLGFLAQGLNKGMGDIPDNLIFLRFCNAVSGDVYIYVWHD